MDGFKHFAWALEMSRQWIIVGNMGCNTAPAAPAAV